MSITTAPPGLLLINRGWFCKHFCGMLRLAEPARLKKKSRNFGSLRKLAATYSRASYTGTTIGKAVFDGRVRDGIGSDHSFMATKKLLGSVVSGQL
jgi:hypothetical protein